MILNYLNICSRTCHSPLMAKTIFFFISLTCMIAYLVAFDDIYFKACKPWSRGIHQHLVQLIYCSLITPMNMGFMKLNDTFFKIKTYNDYLDITFNVTAIQIINVMVMITDVYENKRILHEIRIQKNSCRNVLWREGFCRSCEFNLGKFG